MNAEIYYFSGTGNSLYVSKKISEKLDFKLISISSVMNKSIIETKADTVGIVFPVYFAINKDGIPFLVKRFINKLENLSGKYIFAVSTSGNMEGDTLKNLMKLIDKRGGKLSFGTNLNMSNKSFSRDIVTKFKRIFNYRKFESLNKTIDNSKDIQKKIDTIVELIEDKKIEKIKSLNIFYKIIRSCIHEIKNLNNLLYKYVLRELNKFYR